MNFGCKCLFFLLSERKLHSNETPHNIYIQNYSTATATCIALKKWLFSVTKESLLNSDDVALNFLFWQVIGISTVPLQAWLAQLVALPA